MADLMKSMSLAIALVGFCSACSTMQQVPDEDRNLSYGCDEVVVIGRLSNQTASEAVPIEGDVIGHGWMEADLLVGRIVHGRRLPEILPVRYFAHTFMRGDRNFMFVLKKTSKDYEVTAAQLMSARPLATSTCI